MSTSAWTRWGTGGLVALLLVVAYVTVWRPARAVLTRHVAHPVLTAVSTERARTFDCTPAGGGLSIVCRSAEPGTPSGSFRAPVGILFLLPAVLLALLFPFRPYWLYFWGFHLGLGALQLGAVVLGVAWTDWGFALTGFLRDYVVQGLSLAAPIVALYAVRRPPAGSSPETPPTETPE